MCMYSTNKELHTNLLQELKQEIERRLQRTKEVKYEPRLLTACEDNEDHTDLSGRE